MTEYKASLDTLAKIITIGTFILFTVLGYHSVKSFMISESDLTTIIINYGMLLLPVIILVGCWLYAPRAYSVNDDNLIIKRPANNKKIKLADIAEARVLEKGELTAAIRTFGVGGLFGYYGKFYDPKIGHMLWYATQRKNKMLIKTRQGQKIIITPDNQGLIDDLKQKLTAK